jgi:branched-chain amino acid transport system ATP-binding protein
MATTRTPRNRRDRGAGHAVESYLDETTEVLGDIEDPSELLHEASADGGDLSFAGAAIEDQGGFWSAFNLKKVAGNAGVTPLAILFGLNAVDELDRIAFGTLTPEIKEAFGLSLTGITAITTVVLFVNLLLELPIGYLADRRNRVRIATIGAFAWGFFSILTGLSIGITSLGILYLARIGSAVAKNLNTTHRSLLSDYYPLEARARVFYAHSLANNVGQIIGPLVAGALGAVAGAQLPFYVLAFPTFIFVFLAATRLREPKRGVHERLAAGADQETAEVEEKAAGFAETFRVLFNNKSARRIYYSLPFLTASGIGLGTFLAVYYDQEFGLGPFQRGLIGALTEGFQIAGVLFGFSYVQKVMTRNPGLVMKLLAVAAVLYAVSIGGLALSPWLPLSILCSAAGAACNAVLGPGVIAVISLVVPPRMRALGFATGAVWYILGAPFGLIIASLGEDNIRHGLFVVIPIYLLGSFLLSSAGGPINEDILKVQQSALTQAEARKRRLDGDPQMMVIRGLNAGYDQTQILFDVDFEVADGEIIALLGTNGAGKSTLLKAISGIIQPMSGAIIFDGQDITNADAIQSAHLGIAQVPGGRGIFPSLTVGENLRAGGWMYRKDKAYLDEAINRVTEMFPILKKRWDTPAGALSGGEQQMLSLSQAFIAKPKLLMIDELSLGLAPTIVEQLLDIVRAIHAQGTTIILVEQSVNVALRIAQRAVFMEKGEIRFFGPTSELLERPDILRSVFLEGAHSGLEVSTGSAGEGNGPAVKKTAAERQADQARRDALLENPVVLEVEEITKRYGGVTAVNGVSFQLHTDQVLGLIGPNGAGKTTIFDLISGFATIDGGRVILDGHDVTTWAPHQRARIGLGRSFQDARLWQSLTVRETMAASLAQTVDVTSPLAAAFGLPSVDDSEKAIEAKVDELIDLLGLRAFRDKFISELSTGSRRMVEIATLIANRPKVLILDEPSSGIAQKETEALGPVLKEVQRYTGCAILVIEHDMPLLAGLADHVVGLELGTVIAFGTPDEVLNHPRVIESYLGTASYDEIGIGSAPAPAEEPATNGREARRARRSSTSASSSSSKAVAVRGSTAKATNGKATNGKATNGKSTNGKAAGTNGSTRRRTPPSS